MTKITSLSLLKENSMNMCCDFVNIDSHPTALCRLILRHCTIDNKLCCMFRLNIYFQRIFIEFSTTYDIATKSKVWGAIAEINTNL